MTLIEHFTRMMEAAANYVEPTTYIARHPNPGSLGICKWTTEFPEPAVNATPVAREVAKARRDNAFINDIIYMLDGPEQRLALETQAAEIARLRGLLGEAEAGLEDVINPLRKIQRDAAEQGARLSGMAYAVANDLHFVRDIARTALSKLRAEKEDG